MENACYSCSWQICEHSHSTDVALTAHPTKADGTFVTGDSVCHLADRQGGTQKKGKEWFFLSEPWRGEDVCFLRHSP